MSTDALVAADRQTRYKAFKLRFGDIEEQTDLFKDYLYPLGDTVQLLGCRDVGEFLEKVRSYTQENLPLKADSLCNNRFTPRTCKAIVFFIYEQCYDFYARRPFCGDPGLSRKDHNAFVGTSIPDLFSETCNLPKEPSVVCATPSPPSSLKVIPAEEATMDTTSVGSFLKGPDSARFVWGVRSKGEETIDEAAFGFSLSDNKQRPPVGGIVALHLDVFARPSYKFGSPCFCIKRALLLANIKRDEFTAVEFGQIYSKPYKIDAEVSARLSGGLNRFIEFSAQSGFLNGNYALDEGHIVALQPSTIRFEFETELRAHCADLSLLSSDTSETLNGNKQIVVESIIAAGLGGDTQSGWMTLAKQTVVILPVDRYAG